MAVVTLAAYLLVPPTVHGATVELKPDNDNVDGIQVDFGTQCTCDSEQWYLGADRDSPDDWALAVTMENEGDYAFGSGGGTLDITLAGTKANSQSDLFWGFGDGEKYFTLVHDMDGGVHVGTGIKGTFVYPPCDGSLADGDISTVLVDSDDRHNNAFYAIRQALSGGDNNNWHRIDDISTNNGNNWPTVSITNDVSNDRVTFTFSSDTFPDGLQCAYDGAFNTNSDFVVAMQPDLSNGASDDLIVDSVAVEMIANPFPFTGTPAEAEIIGYIDTADEMHYEFDMTFDAALGPVDAEVFSCGVDFTLDPQYVPIGDASMLFLVRILFNIEGQHISCPDLETEGLSLCSSPPPEVGEAYHFEVDYTQNWVNIRFGDQIIYSKAKSGHSTATDTACYVARGTLSFLGTPLIVPAEQVTLTDFIVSEETTEMSYVEFPTEPTTNPMVLVVEEMALAGDETADTNTPLSHVVHSEEAIDLFSMTMGIAIGIAFCTVFGLLVGFVMRRKGREESVEETKPDEITSAPKECESTTASTDMAEVNA